MASQSLPPPPLACSTPPPIDFGPPDDDEDPFPEEEEPSEELPSFGDDAIPVPDMIPEDSFYYSSPPPPPPKTAIVPQVVNFSPLPLEKEEPLGAVKEATKDDNEEQAMEKPETKVTENANSELDTTTGPSSIHDLLNNHQESVVSEPIPVVHKTGEEQEDEKETSVTESPIESVEDLKKDNLDNPPSLILDINFNLSPTTEEVATTVLEEDEEFGDFSERIKAGEEQSIESFPFETPPSDSMSPRAEVERTTPQEPVAEEIPAVEEAQEQVIKIDRIDFQDETETIPQSTEDVDDDFGDFVENEEVSPANVQSLAVAYEAEPTEVDICDLQSTPSAEEEEQHLEREEENQENCVQNDVAVPEVTAAVEEDDDDFDDFTGFTSSTSDPPLERTTIPAEVVIEPMANEFEADFNQFANFDNFTSQAEGEGDVVVVHKAILTEALDKFSLNDPEEDDDDDDFGDFTSSVPGPHQPQVASVPVVVEKLPPIDISNVDSVLEEMFPVEEAAAAANDSRQKHTTAPILIQLNGYESTALTNEYQWSKSNSNKCLVKCLGIDTRNILHGTKWNPEMPRFAANLGFSPLQPMKPTVAGGVSGGGVTSGGILKPIQAGTVLSGGVTGVAGEVPAAQFDWDSSGLVNPLHASQAHTYLLDLEQLVVVARLENTKTASHTTTTSAPAQLLTTTDAPLHGDETAPLPLLCNNATPGWAINPFSDYSGDQGLLGKAMTTTAEERLPLTNNYDKYSPFRTIMGQQAQELERRGVQKVEEKKVETEEMPAPEVETVPVPPREKTPPIKLLTAEVKEELSIRSVGDGEAAIEPIEDHFVESPPPAPQPLETEKEISPIEEAAEDPSIPVIQSQFLSPLRETHIFTPVKCAVPVSREISVVAGAPVESEAGITVKEYRDVEYDPSRFLGGVLVKDQDDFGEFKEATNANVEDVKVESLEGTENSHNFSISAPEENQKEDDDDDDFTEFQSVPVVASPPQNQSANSLPFGSSSLPPPTGAGITRSNNPLPLSVNNLTSMISGRKDEESRSNNKAAQDSNILMPSILMPKPMASGGIGSMGGVFMNPDSIRWPDNSDQIAQNELQRIEEMFSSHRTTQSVSVAPPTSSFAPHAGKGQVAKEEDEWSDFVSVPGVIVSPKKAAQEQRQKKETSGSSKITNNNSVEDDWTDFVSSAPPGPNFTPWGAASSYGQFSSQPPIPNRPTTHLPPRLGGGTEMQFVDPSPFFISSTAAGLQSMFGGGGGGASHGKNNSKSNSGRK